MITKSNLCIALLFFICISACSLQANIEYDWPKTNFTTYRIPYPAGDKIVIRDNDNTLYGIMELNPGQTDYKTASNVNNSFLFDYFGNYRRSYIDVNKNAIPNGFGEDFNLCTVGENPNNNDNIKWKVLGGDLTYRTIDGSGANKWISIGFDSSYLPGRYFWLGMVQKELNKFKHTVDLSNATISFDISTTGFTTPIPSAMSPAIYANTYNTNTDTYNYEDWRLQNYSGQVYNNTTAQPLIDIPVGTWQTITCNVTDLIYHGAEQHWKLPDFSNVNKFNISFLRVPLESGQIPQWSESGTISIDNLKVGEDCELAETIPMDMDLSLENTYSISTVNSSFHPLQEVTVKMQAVNSGSPFTANVSIIVYDNTFSWPNINTGVIYDSNAQGENQTSYINSGETKFFTFKFRLPISTPAGTCKIFASIENTGTSTIIDSTGPDIAFNDLTALAYIDGFEVLEHPHGDGPVADFVTTPTILSISDTGKVIGSFNASPSYHRADPYYEITTYEWDTDNDGIFDISSSLPVTDTGYDFPDFNPPIENFIYYPITLKTTDNDDPQKTDTITKTITFMPEINLYATNVNITKHLTGDPISPSDEIPAGTTVQLDITVQNDNTHPRECQVQVIASQVTTPPYDFEFPWLEPITIPAGESKTFTTTFSLPQPEDGNSIASYFYLINTRTFLSSTPIITHKKNWTKLFDVKELSASKDRNTNFSFSGYNFVKLNWGWQAGILNDNVSFDESGNLLLTLKDYSGVGAQAESTDWTYHYGTYRAYMKATPISTTYPEGGVIGFFYYGKNEAIGEIHEIDVELRTLDIDSNGGTSYVLFSVHHEINNKNSTVSHKCPVEDISVYHLYEFRWSPTEIAFFIDGELAYNDNDAPAFVNNDSIDIDEFSFNGKIPNLPGRLIMNSWSGSEFFTGFPPQGKGDFTGTFQKVSYTPFPEAIIDRFYKDNDGFLNMNISAYRNNTYSLKHKDNELDNESIPFIELKSLDGQYNYSYKDNDSSSNSITNRFYKITTPEYVE